MVSKTNKDQTNLKAIEVTQEQYDIIANLGIDKFSKKDCRQEIV